MAFKMVILDLDDTLLNDREAYELALVRTTENAYEKTGIEPEYFIRAVRFNAGRLLSTSSYWDDCEKLGISPLEMLWSRCTGEGETVKRLRSWAPHFQLTVWRRALEDWKIYNDKLAQELAALFLAVRRKTHLIFDDAVPALETLRRNGISVALVSNGLPDIQKRKIRDTGLGQYFEQIIISGEMDVGKPDPWLFNLAVRACDSHPNDTVVVGDNPATDILGANYADIASVWLNRDNHHRCPSNVHPTHVTETLADIPDIIAL